MIRQWVSLTNQNVPHFRLELCNNHMLKLKHILNFEQSRRKNV